MGCCKSKDEKGNHDATSKRIIESIERNNTSSIEQVVRYSVNQSSYPAIINEPIITIRDVELNPLAYALWLGKIEIFKHLHQKLNASISSMEALLDKQRISVLHYLCSQGYLEILDYYMPIYLSNHKDSLPQVSEESMTVDFQKAALCENLPIKRTSTPVHLACEKGYINIIGFIHNYFKSSAYVPNSLDIDYQDETTGENCAMIAVRIGNYPMTKYLHEMCNANFRLINKRNESVIQIAAVGSKKNTHRDYYEIFLYLIEDIKADISYQYEETLLLLESKTIIRLLEKCLSQKGIYIKKTELENRNTIKKPAMPKSDSEVRLDEIYGPDFCLEKMLGEYKNERKSLLSSITPSDSKVETPFMSVNGEIQ